MLSTIFYLSCNLLSNVFAIIRVCRFNDKDTLSCGNTTKYIVILYRFVKRWIDG